MTRDRGKWASSTQAMRGSPIRGFCLPKDLHAALDRLAAAKVSLSALAEEALRAHPRVAAELAPQKPAAVLPGQRWRCVGIEGELEVRDVTSFTGAPADVGLRPLGSTGPVTVRARESDMLGLKEWMFVGGPAEDHEAEQRAIVDRMARMTRNGGAP